jgi:hypothetical protein
MMSEWSRDIVISVSQEGNKSVSVNGSRSGTNGTVPRNFLAVNGNFNNGGTNSGTQSPHRDHRSRSASMSYGLVGGLGSIKKLRNGNVPSPSPPSESSRASITRVDQLKKVLSGQAVLPTTSQSDASSESMVSYDYTASEISFNPTGQHQSLPTMERPASLHQPRARSRSKSTDRNDRSRPLSSNPVLGTAIPTTQDDGHDTVPPVPPLPASVTADVSAADAKKLRRRSGAKKSTQQAPSWVEGSPLVDLEGLLEGIDTSGEKGGHVIQPPY